MLAYRGLAPVRDRLLGVARAAVTALRAVSREAEMAASELPIGGVRPGLAALNDCSVALLAASGLPERWRGLKRFALLAAGVDDLRLFVAAWRCWQSDPGRCQQLHVIAVGPLPRDADRALADLDARAVAA